MYQPFPPPVGVVPGSSATVGVGRDDLVSGEAVALDLPAANIGLRVLSGLIDVVLIVLVWMGLAYLGGRLAGADDDALRAGAATVATVLALVVLPTGVETLTRGKSLGHWIVGLRTVRDDAGPIAFRHALSRAMLGVVEIFGCWGVPAFFAALINRKGKRLGDLLAGTYVIVDRHGIKLPDPVEMPPELEHWASTADIAALPDQLALMLRGYLTRRDKLSQVSREALAAKFAADVGLFVAPGPPAGTPPEMFLCAVTAERRRRDGERIEKETALRQRLLR